MARQKALQKVLPGLWRTIRRFWPHLRQHRLLAGGSLLVLLLEVALKVLEPWPLKLIFDRILPLAGGRLPAEDQPFASVETMTLLGLSATSLVLITSLRAMATYWSRLGFAITGQRVLAKVRGELYRHLQYLSLSFHEGRRSGDLLIRVIGDVGLVREVMVAALLPLVAKLLLLAGMLSLMFWFHWGLTLVALIVTPLFWVRTVRLSRNLQHVAREQRKRRGNMAATTAESISAIKTVQALSLQENFAENLDGQDKRDLRQNVKAKRLEAQLQRSVSLMIAVSTALVLFFGGRLVLTGVLTPGDLLVFLAYLKSGMRPVQNMAKYASRLAKAGAAGERILEVLDQQPEVGDLSDAIEAPPLEGRIQFEQVDFAYGDGTVALEGIDLETQPGQTTAVVGPSGSGKSTLLSLLLRLYDPTRGRVLIDGIDIRRVRLNSLRSQMASVLQGNLLFGLSIRENIELGTPGAVSSEEVEEAARLAKAAEFIAQLPEGYETTVGERGVKLSRGQQQRVTIARAAIRKAPILLLDEPTTGLDAQNAGKVVSALNEIARARTTFLVTHDLRFAQLADQILYLQQGRIVERGTHQELMALEGLYSHQFRRQFHGSAKAQREEEGGQRAAS